MNDEIFTLTICHSDRDAAPSWMFYSICALPFVLILLDILT